MPEDVLDQYVNRDAVQATLAQFLEPSLIIPGLLALGMTVVLLVITCANIGGLQIARASARMKEISIRLAIGASPFVYSGLYPLLIAFNAIPKVALVPILMIWVGVGSLPAVITDRLRVFKSETRPLIDHYARRGLLVTVDAIGTIEVVTKRILDDLLDLTRSGE